MHLIDSAGATVDGRFTEGNPVSGTPATRVSADWLNMLQAEILSVLTAAGLEPIKANNAQLLEAILALIAGGGVAVSASGVTVTDAADYFTGGNVELALAQLAEKVYAGTLGASQIRRTIVALAGAAQQTEAAHAENLVEVSHTSAATYTVRPDAALNLPVGTAIQICQAGAGKVTVAAGAGVTILKPTAFTASTLGQDAIVVLIKRAANTWRLGGALEVA